jgi:hypothetical protein
VLGVDRSGVGEDVQRDAVGQVDDEERTEPGWLRQAQQIGQVCGRTLLVAGVQDGVVEVDRHG